MNTVQWSRYDVKYGSSRDFWMTLVAITYLFGEHSSGNEKYAIGRCDLETWLNDSAPSALLEAVTRAYRPHYTITPTAWLLHTTVQQGLKDAFPTAREQYACRSWLTRTCMSMRIDTELVDNAFPIMVH